MIGRRIFAVAVSPGIAVALAGITAADDVNWLKTVTRRVAVDVAVQVAAVSDAFADVSEASDMRPVLLENSSCIRVNFNLPPDLKPYPLRRKVEPANTRKEAANPQFPTYFAHLTEPKRFGILRTWTN